ncbi:hypothetical protein [uncultured Fluviicola sp.]|uniref:hypothetical protein n=1 Tax=uncultured Fluviicola sp. TaxID=463303 RepID=UPI0025D1AC65|nr:hypothetical protein [uncultured Fluviicola sp.]
MRPILLILLALTAHSVFSQSQYKIGLSGSGADSKMYLTMIEDHIPDTYARLTADNVIQFSTGTNYPVNYIDSICTISGIPFENIVKSKGPIEIREKVGGTNCGAAQQICNNTSLPGNSSGYGVQELTNGNSGCLGTEHQSSWYYINVQSGGSLSFRINPSGNSDYDFAVWGPFTAANAAANCPPQNGPVRCSYAEGNGNTGMRDNESGSSENQNGDGWVGSLNVSANQVYILLIDNYSASGVGYTFDFNWGGNTTTAVIGCTPVVLPVEMSSFSGSYSSNTNVLNWSTETELNNDYFQVEWTTTPAESTSWNKLDVIDGAGESQSRLDYSMNHYTYTRNTINYYRIKQVDYNGQIRSYPDIIAIDNRQKSEKLVKVVNLFGQEVSESEKGMVIYVYDDGSTEKRIN